MRGHRCKYPLLSLTTIGIILNKINHLVLRTRQIEHNLVNVNSSLKNRQMLEKNAIKCDNSVKRVFFTRV